MSNDRWNKKIVILAHSFVTLFVLEAIIQPLKIIFNKNVKNNFSIPVVLSLYL